MKYMVILLTIAVISKARTTVKSKQPAAKGNNWNTADYIHSGSKRTCMDIVVTVSSKKLLQF